MQLAKRYQLYQQKFVNRKRRKVLIRELLEWTIAIGLFCALTGYEIGSIFLAVFTPPCKRLWVMGMTVTRLYF